MQDLTEPSTYTLVQKVMDTGNFHLRIMDEDPVKCSVDGGRRGAESFDMEENRGGAEPARGEPHHNFAISGIFKDTTSLSMGRAPSLNINFHNVTSSRASY